MILGVTSYKASIGFSSTIIKLNSGGNTVGVHNLKITIIHVLPIQFSITIGCGRLQIRIVTITITISKARQYLGMYFSVHN